MQTHGLCLTQRSALHRGPSLLLFPNTRTPLPPFVVWVLCTHANLLIRKTLCPTVEASCENINLENIVLGTGEVAQRLRVLPALAQDLHLVARSSVNHS